MIESLKNTAVEVENEEQAWCVVALYELAGFSQFGCRDDDGIILTDDDSYFIGGVPVTDEKTITLDQLAWDCGLAPDWAVDLRNFKNEFIWTNGKQTSCLLDGSEILESHKNLHECEVISTRPQKQQWPEKGSLPPVDVECEGTWGGKVEWVPCMLSNNGRVFTSYGIEKLSEFEGDESFEFRPIQSERDKLTELAVKHLTKPQTEPPRSETNAEFCARILYNARMLKEPD